jgi:hypothetical protein
MTRKCNPLGKILQEETPYKMREISENDEGKGKVSETRGVIIKNSCYISAIVLKIDVLRD